MKILLADDHAMIRQGLVLLLRQSYPSAEIVEKSNGDELLAELQTETKYNIVITDLYMPGTPVIEIIKQVRDAENKVPIIILSMSLPERNAVRVIKAGANGYLTKDTVPEDLIKAMQFVMQGRKYITPDIASLLADAYLDDVEKKPHETLSDREFEVFQMLSNGKTVTQIAEILHVSINTISTYKSRIMDKMNFTSFADIIKYAHANDIVR